MKPIIGKLNLAPKKRGPYRQGYYKLKNPQKYVGDPNNLIYRSQLEKNFYKLFDENPNFIMFSCEEYSIPYVDTTKFPHEIHHYYPDATIKVKTKTNEIITYIIEIKPKSQCKPPRKKKNRQKYIKELQTYQININKWTACSEFAEKNGMVFKVLTEEHLEKI